MSRIFVGAKQADFGFETGKAHSYLVYESNSGTKFVTSLTDVDIVIFPPSIRFDVKQINTPYAHSDEAGANLRVETRLDLNGRNADDIWTIITRHAMEIKDEAPNYDPLTQNSNSFISSLLNVVGIDFARNLPHFDGEHATAGDPPRSAYPGIGNLLDFDYDLAGTGHGDILRGAAGNDHLRGGGGNDAVFGRAGSDTVTGYLGRDKLYGGSGNDHLDGSFDGDAVWGQSGNDWILGGSGNDTLDGGAGVDRIAGGGGADRFAFGLLAGPYPDGSSAASPNVITDFVNGTDRFLIDRSATGVDGFTNDIVRTQIGGDVRVTLQNAAAPVAVVLLLTEQVANIDASDFIFIA